MWVFVKKIESVQHNAALAITGAIQGTSRETCIKTIRKDYINL